MARKLSDAQKKQITDLVLSGHSQRAIAAITGASPQSVRNLERRHRLKRPDCACGRAGGHMGMCSARKQKPKHQRPSSPNWNIREARTELGKLIDAHCARRGLLLIRFAEAMRIAPLRLNRIRHQHRNGDVITAKAMVPAELVDRMADYFELDARGRWEMHVAAATDWGFKVVLPATSKVAAPEKKPFVSVFDRTARRPDPRAPRPRGTVVELEDIQQTPFGRSLTGSSLMGL